MLLQRAHIGVIAVFALGGCNAQSPPSAAPTGPPTFAQLYEQVFKPSCASAACHSGGSGIANLSFDDPDTAYAQLIDVSPINGPAAAAGMKRVVAGDPDASFLLRKLASTSDALTVSGQGARMPLASTEVLGQTTLDDIAAWIEAGAPRDGAPGRLEVVWEGSPDAAGYVQCDATDEAGLRECFPPAEGSASRMRLFTPPMTLPPGSEVIMCNFLEVTDDTLLLTGAGAKQMNGGHHAGLFVSVVKREVGTSVPCDDVDMSSLRFVIGAGGAGGLSTPIQDGLALRVRKGEQLVIQSHYINSDPTSRTVMDAVDLSLTTLDTDPTIADSFALIDSDFEVPVGADNFRRVKECTMNSDIDIHLLLGHTHDYGVLFELEVIKQGQQPWLQYQATDGPTLRDNPEIQTLTEPLSLTAGDKLRMTCEWDNPTDHALGWPEEMCVTFMFYTPGNGWMTCDTYDDEPQVAGSSGAGCRVPGDTGNDQGVGTYCTADGDECADNGAANFCLAAFSDANNYCSVILCQSDDVCGEGASCVADGPGSACILNSCE